MSDTGELYLILHKVRGEPAFDIAQKLMIGDEEGWIVPTSGHRAYPYDSWPLDTVAIRVYWEDKDIETPVSFPRHLPNDWPDHYSINNKDHKPTTILTNARDLLAKLGLGSPQPAIKRRKIG